MTKHSSHYLIVAGTRPELIKLAPLALALRRAGQRVTCYDSAQHDVLTRDLWRWFGLEPAYTLQPARDEPRLTAQLAQTLAQLGPRLADSALGVDAVIVQGDTTTALAAAYAAFYQGLPVIHLEAGLRTQDLSSPWPEELHRRQIALLATLHLAPTEQARAALLREGIHEAQLAVVGNTVIDALLWTSQHQALPSLAQLDAKHQLGLRAETPYCIITAHRRESFAAERPPLVEALRQLIEAKPELDWIIPTHPSPRPQAALRQALSSLPQVRWCAPLPYPDFVALLKGAHAVLTDSGGVQEEAPTLGVPLLILRDNTERVEVIEAGAGLLLGASDVAQVVSRGLAALNSPLALDQLRAPKTLYGRGDAAARAVQAILRAPLNAPGPRRA